MKALVGFFIRTGELKVYFQSAFWLGNILQYFDFSENFLFNYKVTGPNFIEQHKNKSS